MRNQMKALKLFSNEKVRKWDEYTVLSNSESSLDLMERAAQACTNFLLKQYPDQNIYTVFCGNGNNGGDGYAIARLLSNKGLKVFVFSIQSEKEESHDCKMNKAIFIEKYPTFYKEITKSEDIPEFNYGTYIIDAIFGSGLHSSINGLHAECIDKINKSNVKVIAIDMPSGLFADQHTNTQNAIVSASVTISFQIPNKAFLFPENHQFVGKWMIVDIGLSNEYYESTETNEYLLDEIFIKSIQNTRSKFAHKGNFGHACLVAGSYGKTGAAILAGSAALRSGVGLLTIHAPRCADAILQTTLPEAMLNPDDHDHFISGFSDISKFSAIGVGPGIGTALETNYALQQLLKASKNIPLVIDADAINLLASDSELISYLPENTILTPHIGEFKRLLGDYENDFERFEKQKEFSRKYSVYIVLKGAHTCITCPNGTSYFNSTGNVGMAKGGSGDALTGVITALLAQTQNPLNSALTGVFVHGLAGDYAAVRYGSTSMKAADIIQYLPEAFKKIELSE